MGLVLNMSSHQQCFATSRTYSLSVIFKVMALEVVTPLHNKPSQTPLFSLAWQLTRSINYICVYFSHGL
jgi:hypothetical protein